MNEPVTSAHPDRLDRHFRLTLLAALALGYGVLFAAEVYPFWVALPLTAALLLASWRFFDPLPPWLPSAWWTALTVLWVGVPALLLLANPARLPAAISFVFLGLPFIKLMTGKTARDHLQLFGLAFAALLYGSVVNFELSYGLALLGSLILTAWGLILLAFREFAPPAARENARRQAALRLVFRPSYLAFLGALVLLLALLTALIFTVVPRPGYSRLSASLLSVQRAAGLSEQVDLGRAGAIVPDTRIAFRATSRVAPIFRFIGAAWC